MLIGTNLGEYVVHNFLRTSLTYFRPMEVAEFDIDPVPEQPVNPNPFISDVSSLFNSPIFR